MEGRNVTDKKIAGTRHVSRRIVLVGVGATLALAAGGVVWRANAQGLFNPGTGPAFEPWADWRGEGHVGPQALVPAAILAANAHNTQPWRFQIGEAHVDLFADRTRTIGVIDPRAREMDFSLGCALENLLLAARANGYTPHLTLAPEGAESAPAARVDLAPGQAEVSPLYAAIPHRHTNRYAYDTSRPVSRATLEALQMLGDDPAVRVFWFVDGEERQAVGQQLVAAAAAINADTEQASDNVEMWTRQDRSAVQRHRDGLTLETLGLSPFELIVAKLLPPPSLSNANAAWLQSERRQVATAAVFGMLAVRDESDLSQRMRAGRLWQRMHLWLTNAGLAAQPMNQLHERADREAQLGIDPTFGDSVDDLVGDSAWRGVFTFRLGFPTKPAVPSPRRALVDVVETSPAA